VCAIIAGGLFGLAGGKWISKNCQETILKADAACVLFVGISGAVEYLLSGEYAGGSIMLVVSFALGSLVGELLDLEGNVERLGKWLRDKTGSSGDGGFVNGFVTATLAVCVGAMAIVGAIQDGLTGDYSTLALKAVLDFIFILVMTPSFGKGCMFAALPVGVWQGGITLLARWIGPAITPMALANLSLTGSILIFCLGVNLIRPKTFRIMNMLPTIFIAAAWAYFV
jgi:hypothetical protein